MRRLLVQGEATPTLWVCIRIELKDINQQLDIDLEEGGRKLSCLEVPPYQYVPY